jgi:hypothetical protein
MKNLRTEEIQPLGQYQFDTYLDGRPFHANFSINFLKGPLLFTKSYIGLWYVLLE